MQEVSKKTEHSSFQGGPENRGFTTFEKLKNIWAKSLALELTPRISDLSCHFLKAQN